MALLDFLTKKNKNISKVIDDAASGIDKLFFTKEEKADSLQKIADAQAQFVLQTISENSIRSKTRRYIAVLIMAVFLGFLVFGVGIYGWNKDWASYAYENAKELSNLALMVAGFYFGSYAISEYIMKPLINKPKKNKQ